MADEVYVRLSFGWRSDGVLAAAMKKARPGRGGARVGAGRPKKGEVRESTRPRPLEKRQVACLDCGTVVDTRSVKPRCMVCIDRRRAAGDRWCGHPKPLFANGKERKVCFDCAPKPEWKERKPYSLRDVAPIKCEAAGCTNTLIKASWHNRFCGIECRSRANVDAARIRRNQIRSPIEPSLRTCKGCAVAFSLGIWRQQTYCSKPCRRKHRRDNIGHTHKRRATKHGVTYTPFDPAVVMERDGWKCRICGIPTPKELRGKFVHNAPELDHDVPLSRGGHHTLENAQCLCRSCNQMKSTRTTAEVLQWLSA